MTDYVFTTDWFQSVRPSWDQLIPQIRPRKILEVGSFEGQATCYLIDKLASEHPIEIHCIDTWLGSIELHASEMSMKSVEENFLRNCSYAIGRNPNHVKLELHKGHSNIELPNLLSQGYREYFDFIYIDGSHQAPDVLFDAVVGFELLKPRGVMVFDDYLWAENLTQGIDHLRCPKPAIDAFVNLNIRRLSIVKGNLQQFYIQKN